MNRIWRHPIDKALAEESFRLFGGDLTVFVNGARRNPNNLTLLSTRAKDAALLGMVTGQMSAGEAAKHLRLASQALGALFAAASNPSVTVPLGYDDEEVTFASPIDDSIVHVGRWLDAFFLAMLCRDWNTIDLLEQTPAEVLSRSRTRSPEYRYIWREAMIAFGQNKGNAAGLLLQAIEATDPERDDIHAPDWTLWLDVPRLAALTYLAGSEPEFQQAMEDAVTRHKQFYSKKQDRRRDWDGFYALNLMGIGTLADLRRMPCEIDSDYWVTEWVEGGCFGA
jgi:hypothetical protein